MITTVWLKSITEIPKSLSRLSSLFSTVESFYRDADVAGYYGNQTVPGYPHNGTISDPAPLPPPGIKNLESIGNSDLDKGWTDEVRNNEQYGVSLFISSARCYFCFYVVEAMVQLVWVECVVHYL